MTAVKKENKQVQPQDRRWLPNDLVARSIELLLAEYPRMILIDGIQAKFSLSDNYKEVQKQYRRLGLGDDALDDKIFVSFHHKNKNHFVLSLYQRINGKMVVFYYDSMNAKMPDSIKEQYTAAFGEDVKFDDTLLIGGAQQTDSFNCGVHVIDNLAVAANELADESKTVRDLSASRERLFPRKDAQYIKAVRESIVTSLNDKYDGIYELEHDGGITDLTKDVLSLQEDKVFSYANKTLNDMLDNASGDLQGEDRIKFEAMFDKAADAYSALHSAKESASRGDKKQVAEHARFFRNAATEFNAYHRAAKLPKSCASEAQKPASTMPGRFTLVD